MEVQNIATRAKYNMPKESWDALGKNQKLFTVLNSTDEDQTPPQIIDNLAKPKTGQAENKNNTQSKQSKEN